MDLAAIDDISRLKYRYLRALDTKSWAELAETVTEDAGVIYGEFDFDSRAAFVSFCSEAFDQRVITEHQVGQPQILVDGDSATGTWQLSETTIVPGDGVLLRTSAYYDDRYRRQPDGNWLIAHTQFSRVWEVEIKLEDLPSFRLAFNRWGAEPVPPAAN